MSGLRSGFKMKHSRSFGSLQNCIVSSSNSSLALHKSFVPSDLFKGLKDQLPQHFSVTSGTYGQDASTTFAVDEKFTAHFIHRWQFLLLKTQSGNLCKAPIRSLLNVGLIYNPRQRLDLALSGYVFGRPATLLESLDRPKIVVVLQGHDDKDPQYTVEPNDVLFIEGETTAGKKRFLRCIHVASGLSKLLREDWTVVLSTRPDRIFVPLYSIVKYVACPFTTIIEFPKSLSVASIGDQKQQAVVATFLAKGEDRVAICTREHGKEIMMFALPETVDIEFEISKCNKEDYETLCMQSVNYLKQFNPSKVSYELLTSSVRERSPSDNDIQSAIYKSMAQEKADHNSIVCPQSLHKYFPFKKISTPHSTLQPSSLESRLTLLEQAVQGLFSEMQAIKERCEKPKEKEPSQETHIAEAAFDMAVELRKAVSKLQTEVTDMKIKSLSTRSIKDGRDDADYQPLIPPKCGVVQKVIPTIPTIPTCKRTQTSSEPLTVSAINQQYLKALNVQQVSEILVELGMREYIQSFQNHNISGEILLRLNESDLKRLTISDPVHRKKLMQIISGQESAFPYANNKRYFS